MQALDGALGMFLGVYSAARAVAVNSTLAARVKLAASWCLDINAPLPAAVFAEEFADVAARIAAVFPEQGRHLGAVLAAVLRDARGPGGGGAAEGRLEESDRRLIEPDQQNIAGTSHFHIVRKRIEEIVPAPESANASEIAELVNATPELLREMETGVERMENRARAWRPFEEYSDILDQLAWRRGVEPDREAWRDANRLACDLLRRGLELATGSEEAARLPLQVKLLDRVTRYGAELARLGRYRQVVEFESRFLEVPPHALTPDQECYIHAHLAQADYALSDYRRAMQHMAAANAGEHGELITAEDLRRLK